MPLSSKGSEILGKMQSRYGSEKGKRVFYAKENKDKKFARVVKRHRGRSSGRAVRRG